MSAQTQIVAGLAREASQRTNKNNKHFTIREPGNTNTATNRRVLTQQLTTRPRKDTPKLSHNRKTLQSDGNNQDRASTTTTTTTHHTIQRKESKNGAPSPHNSTKKRLSSPTRPNLWSTNPAPNNSALAQLNLTPAVVVTTTQKSIKSVDDDHGTIPLGAVLHILRERRKDQLNLQCLIYLFFLLVYTGVANLHHPILNSFSQNSGLREMLLNEPFSEPDDLRTYHDIGELDEWWLWFEGPFAGKIWETKWNNDQPRSLDHQAVLLTEAYVVGNIRIRQVRSKKYKRKTGGRSFLGWHAYSPEYEMTGDSDVYGDYTPNGLSELNGMSYDPFLTVNYGYGGYVVDLSRNNATASLNHIKALKAKRWLDGGTRAIAVDVNVYNPSSDVVTAIRVTTEFFDTGLILKQGWAFSARKTLYSQSFMDIVRALMECIVVLFVLYYWMEEIKEICKAGGCFSFRFTIFDILSQFNLFLIVCAITIHLYFSYTFYYSYNNENEYTDLYTPLEWWSVKKNLVGSTLLFGYMRLFRYLELNARIKVLIYAMLNSWEDLVTTFFVLLTCIVAFAVCGMLLFGENLQEFSAVGFAMSTLLRAMIGDFACYENLRYFHPSLAPTYYASYVFVVLLVVFNMLIAVIIDGYEEAKNIILHQKVDNDRAPFVHSRQYYIFKKIWLSAKVFFLKMRSNTKKRTKRTKRQSTTNRAKQAQRAQTEDDRLMKHFNISQVVPSGHATATANEKEHEEKEKEKDMYTTTQPALPRDDSFISAKKRASIAFRLATVDARGSATLSAVVQRLNQNHHIGELNGIRLEHLVEHVKRANDTLKPAQELKELFHGKIEEKFKMMYTRDTLSTHASGDEALVRLNCHDLEGILGCRKKAFRVLELYHLLKELEKVHKSFITAQR